MLSTHSTTNKINNANYKGYVNEKLNEEMNSGDTRHAEVIIYSFKFKSLTRKKTEGVGVKLEPIETIDKRGELRKQKEYDEDLSDMSKLGEEERTNY